MLLYKYLGRNDFFANRKLRFTPPNDLNDPRECVPELRFRDPRGYVNNVIQRNFESGYLRLLIENPHMTPDQALVACLKASGMMISEFNQNNDEWVKNIFNHFMSATNRNIGILSLTESDNNELMWAHYANSHNGFAVGLDSEHQFFKPSKNDPKTCGELLNVVYSDVSPIVYVEPGKFDIPREVFFTKTKKWDYEREWRMIRMLSHASEVKNGNIHLFEIPEDAIQEVVFGCKVAGPEKSRIEKDFRAIVPHVRFRHACFDHKGKFTVS